MVWTIFTEKQHWKTCAAKVTFLLDDEQYRGTAIGPINSADTQVDDRSMKFDAKSELVYLPIIKLALLYYNSGHD